MPPILIQFFGSLAAILFIAWLVRRMGLGNTPSLGSAQAVNTAAGEVEDGFTPAAIAVDRRGQAALARDGQGRIMVLRPHGGHIAGRVLTAGACADISGDRLTIDCGERRFGSVSLEFDGSRPWADAINRLSGIDRA